MEPEESELFKDFKAISARVTQTALPVEIRRKKPPKDHEPSSLSMMMAETKETFQIQPGMDSVGISVEEIVSLIRPPFSAIKDRRGYIYDTATIAVRCNVGHRHRYFIKDIQMGILSCTTCIHGTKIAKRMRETFEEVLEVPFVVISNTSGKLNTYIYINPPLGITIEYKPIIMESICDYQPGKVRITMGKNSSVGKIKSDIGKFLSLHPLLSPNQLANVTKLIPKSAELKKRNIFIPKPIPFISHVADTSPLLAKRKMFVLDDARLCIENT